MSETNAFTGNLSNHCANNQCKYCRSQRAKAVAAARKPVENPRSPWDMFMGEDKPASVDPIGWSGKDSTNKITTLKTRVKGHRLVRRPK